MTRYIVKEESLPGYAAALPQLLASHGMNWKFSENAPLPAPGKRIQVRDTTKVAPPREVGRYRQAIKRGDQLPPAIVTADGYVVDGNTRIEAARLAGLAFFPQFVIDVVWDDAPANLREEVQALGAALNLTHGRGMSAAEIEALILSISDPRDSAAEVAARLHISKHTANRVMAMARARERAARLGVELGPPLSPSHIATLGGKTEKLNDEPWAELVKITCDAGLANPGMEQLARKLQSFGSDKEKMAFLAAQRAELAPAIRGGGRLPSRAGKIRRSLGYLLAHDNPEDLTELNPVHVPGYVRQLEQALEVIQKILAAQKQTETARKAVQ